MKITENDVAYVAGLASLEVPPDESRQLAAELSRILDFVEKLNELDLSGIEPLPQTAGSGRLAAREDLVVPRTGSSEAGRTVKLFRVPKVITER